jgi:hypothetical protein
LQLANLIGGCYDTNHLTDLHGSDYSTAARDPRQTRAEPRHEPEIDMARFEVVTTLGDPGLLAEHSGCVFRRIIRSQLRGFLSAWQRHWRGEVPNPDGGTIIMHADCKVTTDGKSMVCHTYGGELSGIWFITYDSHRKRMINSPSPVMSVVRRKR